MSKLESFPNTADGRRRRSSWSNVGDRLFTIDWSKPDQDPWIFGGILPLRGRGLLVSRHGLGKTFIFTELCLALALNDRAFGRFSPGAAVTNRRSLFLALEDSEANMYGRLEALLRARGIQEITPALRQDLNRNLKFITIEESGGRLHLRGQLDKIRRWADDGDEGPALICMDTLARLRGTLDENDASQMEAAIIAPLTELYSKRPGAYVFSHHPPVGKELRARGSGSIEDAMDFTWHWTGKKFTLAKMRSNNFAYPAIRETFDLELVPSIQNESVSWSVNLDILVDLGGPSRRLLAALEKGGSTLGRLTPREQRAVISSGSARRAARDQLILKGLAQTAGRDLWVTKK